MRPRSFEIQKREVHEVNIGMEHFVQKPSYTSMSADGIFASPLLTFLARGIPATELAPAFEVKAVDNTTIRNVAVRYEAVHQGVDVIYPLGDIFIVKPFLVV